MGRTEIHSLSTHRKHGCWMKHPKKFSAIEDKTRFVHFIWVTLGVLMYISNLVLTCMCSVQCGFLMTDFTPLLSWSKIFRASPTRSKLWQLCFPNAQLQTSLFHQSWFYPVSFCAFSMPVPRMLLPYVAHFWSPTHCWTSLWAPSMMQSHMKIDI